MDQETYSGLQWTTLLTYDENFRVPFFVLPVFADIKILAGKRFLFSTSSRHKEVYFCLEMFVVFYFIGWYASSVLLMESSGGFRPRAKGGEGGFVLLALPAFLPSMISSFFTQNKRRGGGRTPYRRSTTEEYLRSTRNCFRFALKMSCILWMSLFGLLL